MTASLLLLAAAAAATGPVLVAPAELQGADAEQERWLGPAAAELTAEALRSCGASVLDPGDARLAAERLELQPGPPSRAAALRLLELTGSSSALLLGASLHGSTLSLSARRLDAGGSLGSPTGVSGPLAGLDGVVTALAARLAGASGGCTGALPPGPATLAWARGLGDADTEERRASLERAVAAAPGHDGPRFALGLLFREAGEPEAAAEVFAAVRGAALGRRAALQRGLALLEAGEAGAALESFERLARDRPSPAVWNAIAVARLRSDPTRVPDGVFAALERAAELAPEAPEIAFNRAWAELRAGRADAAASRLEALVASRPRDALARLVRVWSLALAGEVASRDAEWDGLLALAPGLGAFREPDLARPLERLIASEHPLAAGGDPRRAAERAADALGRAERLLSAGAFDAAWREASRAVYLDPDLARAHLVLARTLRARGEDEAGLRALRVALWVRDDPATRRELVSTLEELGRGDEARAEARRLLALDPEDPVGQRVLAR